MNIKKYLSALLLALAISTQNAGILGDVINDTENIASDAVNDTANIASDVVNDTGNATRDVLYNDNNRRYDNNNNNNNIFRNSVNDVIYTPVVAADKVVHPITSIKRPFRTTGDIVPVQTYEDYREEYDYNA